MMTVINHLNMVQNKLIRAAASGVCGEPVMINRLLDNGSCFTLGYEVMSRLSFLRRYARIRWRADSEWKDWAALANCLSLLRIKKDVSEVSLRQPFRSDWISLMLSLSSKEHILLLILSLSKNNSNDQRTCLALSGLALMQYCYIYEKNLLLNQQHWRH